MERYYLHDIDGNTIGIIHLEEKIVDIIGKSHPEIKLGYTWNLIRPEHILSFSLIFEPKKANINKE